VSILSNVETTETMALVTNVYHFLLFAYKEDYWVGLLHLDEKNPPKRSPQNTMVVLFGHIKESFIYKTTFISRERTFCDMNSVGISHIVSKF